MNRAGINGLDKVLAEAQQLSQEDRLRLIQRVAESLLPTPRSEPRYLTYGEYGGGRKSTDENLKIAEWRPTESDLDGS